MTTFTTQDRQDAQRTPLTDEQINEILESLDVYIDTHAGVLQGLSIPPDQGANKPPSYVLNLYPILNR